MQYYAIVCYAILFYAILCCAMLCYTMLCYATPFVMLSYITCMLHCAVLCGGKLYTPRYATLCKANLGFTLSFSVNYLVRDAFLWYAMLLCTC